MKIIWTVTLLAAIASPAATGADVSIGPLCLSGVKSDTDTSDVSFANGSQWVRVEHRFPAHGYNTANVVVFAQAVPQDAGQPPDCQLIRAKAVAKGIPIVIDGQIESISMKSRVEIGGTHSSIWIDPDGKLSLTLMKVMSGFQSVGGGQLQMKGSKLWIRNVGSILDSIKGITGTLEIEAYDRSISDALLMLPGDVSATAIFKQVDPDDDNLTIRLDLSSSIAQLWNANLEAKAVLFKGATLALPGYVLDKPAFSVEKVKLVAKTGLLTGSLNNLSGAAESSLAANGRFTTTSRNIKIVAGSVIGLPNLSTEAFSWPYLNVAGLQMSAVETEFAIDSKVLASGPAKASVTLAQTSRSGTIDWTAPKIANLPLAVPDGKAKRLELKFSGAPNALMISGHADVSAFALAGFEVLRPLLASFAPASTATTVKIPINISTSAVGGSAMFSDYDQKAIIQAELGPFKLNGDLNLDLSDPIEKSSFNIDPGGLAASLKNAVSLQPWLAGTKPGFGKLDVEISNSSLIILRKTASEGALDVKAGVLTLAEPVFRMGEEASPKRAKLALSTEGAVDLTYGVADRKWGMQKAKFIASNLEFSMLDPGGSVDVGGTIISEPNITMKNLLIDLDRKADIKVTRADGIKISGSQFERMRTEKTETAFKGNQDAPFTVASLSGVPEFNDTSITVRTITANGVNFALKNASLTLGDALLLHEANIGLSANSIRSSHEIQYNPDGSEEKDADGVVVRKRREYFDAIKVNASGKVKDSEFSNYTQVDVPPTVSGLELSASGRSDKLDGAGSVGISAFSGLYKDKVQFGFACKGGARPEIPTETRFSTGGSVGKLGIEIRGGKFGVRGALLGLHIGYLSHGTYECDSDSEKIVLSPRQEWWTWGWCPTWDDPGRTCKWSTVIPEVNIGYHLRFGVYGFTGQAAVSAPIMSIKDGETKVCFAPPVIFNPMAIAMGISPQLEFSGSSPGDLEKILNGAIHAVLVPIESTFATGIANGLGLAVAAPLNDVIGAPLACSLLRKDF